MLTTMKYSFQDCGSHIKLYRIDPAVGILQTLNVDLPNPNLVYEYDPKPHLLFFKKKTLNAQASWEKYEKMTGDTYESYCERDRNLAAQLAEKEKQRMLAAAADRFCVTCIHHSGGRFGVYCRAKIGAISPVTGSPLVTDCYELRKEGGACGPDGLHWTYDDPTL